MQYICKCFKFFPKTLMGKKHIPKQNKSIFLPLKFMSIVTTNSICPFCQFTSNYLLLIESQKE